MIQLEHERMKIDKELALERIQIEKEKQQSEMELLRQKLDLISAVKISVVFDGASSLDSGPLILFVI